MYRPSAKRRKKFVVPRKFKPPGDAPCSAIPAASSFAVPRHRSSASHTSENAGSTGAQVSSSALKPLSSNTAQGGSAAVGRKKSSASLSLGLPGRKVNFKKPGRFVPPSRSHGGSTARGGVNSFKPPSNAAKLVGTADPSAGSGESYWKCMFTKRSAKKRKVYEDGIIVLDSLRKRCTLQSMEGKEKGWCRTKFSQSSFTEGFEFDIRNWEVEIYNRVPDEEYLSGRVFINANVISTSSTHSSSLISTSSKARARAFVAPSSVNPASKLSLKRSGTTEKVLRPLFDPKAKGAVTLHAGVPGKSFAVVLDPWLGGRLRPHQIEGVRFMYSCVTGRRNHGQYGCILADEMGLGKTLQSIALVWTLVKQGPRGPKRPISPKAIIVTPSSLVMNWMAEFNKWLGRERMQPIAVNAQGKAAKAQVQDFLGNSTRFPVLIISYEMCVKYHDLISTGAAGRIRLLICDEGHRLKNASGNKTIRALSSLPTDKIVLLTGTPVQNRLQEFYAMSNLCNPGILGDLPTFKRIYQGPIDAGRNKNANMKVKKLGEERSEALAQITKSFVLRRTADINQKYLPPRQEIIIFCRLTDLQKNIYRHIVDFPDVARFRTGRRAASNSNTVSPLPVINCITKLCNHPDLVRGGERSYLDGIEDYFRTPKDSTSDPNLSGKMTVLMSLLRRSRIQADGDRFVIVSNYTKTLDIISSVCTSCGMSSLRLDGATKNSERQALVDRFNKKNSSVFIFFLSAKAGGCGLNLIGANRLVLFDPAWNPATDRQAMARVWRDGQKKEVFIYRMLSTATVEERVYQRQILKEEVAATVVDRAGNKDSSNHAKHATQSDRHFSPEELKKLFAPPGETDCDTFDLISQMEVALDSESDESDNELEAMVKNASSKRAVLFPKYTGPSDITDPVLRSIVAEKVEGGRVSFVRCVQTKLEASPRAECSNTALSSSNNSSKGISKADLLHELCSDSSSDDENT